MNKFLLGVLILFITGSCSQTNKTENAEEKKDSLAKTASSFKQEEKKQAEDTNSLSKSQFEIKTFAAEGNTFGYEIWIDGQKTIHQPNIPGIAGSKGFSSEEKARKVAELVVSKIKRNQMPPSVTAKELDSLGVLK